MRFEDFAAARLPALLRYATLLSGEHEQARDIVQEVLARTLLKWDRIEGADEIRADRATPEGHQSGAVRLAAGGAAARLRHRGR